MKGSGLLMLIDGNSLAYRAYFAFIRNPLRNSRGENTSAAFAFTNSILKLLREYDPEYVGLAFDSKAPTFRHQQYEEYKAQRPPMPGELSSQLRWIREIGKGLGFEILEVPGYEADDIMATLAREAESRGYEVLLVTSDKDLLQLVTDRVKVLDTRPRQEVLYDRNAVISRFGVPPERIPDYLALVGDQIDNIPGVPGIGDKSARELLSRFGSLEDIYQHIDEIGKPKLRELLLKYRDQVFFARELARLRFDAPLHIEIQLLKRKKPDRKLLFEVFRELEFASLMAEMADYPPPIREREGVPAPAELGEFPLFTVSDEYIIVMSSRDEAWRIPLRKGHGLLIAAEQKGCFDSKTALRSFLDKGLSGFEVDYDTKLASYLLDPGKPRHDLEFVAMEKLGYKIHEEHDLRKLEEVQVAFLLRDDLIRELKEKELYSLYRDIELPLAGVLAGMEHRGILVDRSYLEQMGRELDRKLLALIQEIYDLAGESFNINSPRQLAKVLFEKLKLPPVKKTKTGYSTDFEVLQKLSEIHELPRKILEYRELFKLKSTYVSSLVGLIDEGDGRIHPTFNQTGTSTGRLSCSNPNLQNIPIRSEIGRELRRAFIASPGYKLLSADYSQIELRILAHMTGDENLIDAYMRDADIHRKTASYIFNKKEEDVTGLDRRKAKVVNFGITYGMSPYGLAKELNISNEEAAQIIYTYFATYPRVAEWIQETLKFAREKGYVTTLLGRRRYVPEINSGNRTVREFAERIAINAPIQGSAADLIKKAMVDIWREFRGKEVHMLLQIHDELLFEIKEELVSEAGEIIKEKMEGALELKVPLKVDMGVGDNWLEAHP
ncbi:MAG: DNA polymerase I [Candidatus Hydrothermota bacterium]|nr:MAG: DNA polymerase I [Candidatus Hydrothermae bacterium]